MSQQSAPKLAPKPGKVKVFRAMYTYTAQEVDELSFEEGEILYVLDMSNANWWKAKAGGSVGLVPSNYVEAHTEVIDCPLHEAAKRGNVDFMNECLSNNVSVNGLDKSGSTALHWAAHGGHLECARVLLQVPCIQVTVQNKLGDTALHAAAWKSRPELVELLLERSVDKSVVNKDGKTAFDLARDPECARRLQRCVSMPDAGYGDEGDSD